MKSVFKGMRLLGMYFRVNLSSALEYRASFWLQVFGMMLSNLSFVFFWWTAFQRVQGSIGGYEFADVMFIWALTSSAFGLGNIVFGNQTQLTRMILQGELDLYLMQPKSLLLNLLCSRSSFSAWGDFIYGFALFAIVQNPGLSDWMLFVLSVPTAAVLMTAIAVVAHACTFFLGNASVISMMVTDFTLNFCIYPLGIYRGFMRLLIFTLVPAGFVAHVPLQLLRAFSFGKALGLLGFACGYGALAWAFWNRGLRRYASGNLITTRM